MVEMKIPVTPFGWSALEPADPRKWWKWARNIDTHLGVNSSSKGYVIHRQVAASKTNKAGLVRIHVSDSGKRYRWFQEDTNLYKDDGATPTSLVGSLTEKHGAATFNDPSTNLSGWFPGLNTQAYLIRENSAGTDIEAKLHDIGQPTLTATSTTGAGIPDGTYRLRVCWLDDNGAVVATVFGEPSNGSENTSGITCGGGNNQITVTEPASAPARATKVRVAFTAAGVGDTPSAYLYYEDLAVGFTSKAYTALPSVQTTQAFTDINGTYRQAALPITAVDICCMHEGRLWVGSTASNQVAASERGNPNHWYTDQVIKAGTDTGWHGLLRGLASTGSVLYAFTDRGVNIIYGSFGRDDEGPLASDGTTKLTATYQWDAKTAPLDDADCVGHRTITVIDGRVLWLSGKGPMLIDGGRPQPLGHRDIRPEMDCWDWANITRAHACEDHQNRYWCLAIPRKTNSSRPMDGASTAGICDTIYRWDFVYGLWACPLAVETVDLDAQEAITQGQTTRARVGLWAMGPHGTCIRFGIGRAGGTTNGVVTSANYDGILCASSTTTSATFALSGISANDFVGYQIVIYYPTTDTGFPSFWAVKTISSNTATSGGNITVNWQGALTVPSSTQWTVRVAGHILVPFFRVGDLLALIPNAPPDARAELIGWRTEWSDEVGAESVA